MKKKALSLALALALCLGLTLPVFADNIEGNNADFVPPSGIDMEAGDREGTDMDGTVYRLSNPVIEPISNFEFYPVERIPEDEKEDWGPEEYSDTYYKVPVGTVVTMLKPDGTPVENFGTEDYFNTGLRDGNTLEIDAPGPIIIKAGGDGEVENQWLFLYGVVVEQTANPDTTPTDPSSTDPEPTTPPAAEPAVASPTNDSLTADGVLQTPTVYKINGSNYFKIRDLAAILNGTEKQFSVGYDAELKSVTATTGEGYEKQEGDLAGAPAGGDKTAEPSNDAIYINGEKVEAEVYKIDGSNYFKLRDLGKALDFYVGYSAETGVFLETGKPYSE